MPNPIMKMVYGEMKKYCNSICPSDLEARKRYEINIFKLLIIKFRCKNYLKKGIKEEEYNEGKKKYLIAFVRDRFEDTYDMCHLQAIDTIFDFVKKDYHWRMERLLNKMLSIINGSDSDSDSD